MLKPPESAKNERYFNLEERLTLRLAGWITGLADSEQLEKIFPANKIDWRVFNHHLAIHELAPFAYSFFNNHFYPLPKDEADFLKRSQIFSLAHLAVLETAFFELFDAFNEQKVCLIPLKGAAFLADRIYGELAGLRPMADIDILVKKDELGRAEKLAQDLGYQKELCGLKEDYWRQKIYHIVYVKKSTSGGSLMLEIHWLLDYPRKINLLPSIWERTRRIKAGDREIDVLSPEDTLFSLALHLRRFGNVLCLKSACDLLCLLKKYKELDWDYILREAKSGQMRAVLFFRLVQAKKLFDLESYESKAEKLRIPGYRSNLIENFILRNTFSLSNEPRDNVFLKNHFLVYDNFREPLEMIINMPLEQFAKYYRLVPYSKKTLLLYWFRFLYYPFRLIKGFLKAKK